MEKRHSQSLSLSLLSCQVFGIASETCGIGKCDAPPRRRGTEGGKEKRSFAVSHAADFLRPDRHSLGSATHATSFLVQGLQNITTKDALR